MYEVKDIQKSMKMRKGASVAVRIFCIKYLLVAKCCVVSVGLKYIRGRLVGF